MTLILASMPSAKDFFALYWNKKPFVVRGLIPDAITDQLIDEDHLAGLSMEEEVTSRLVKKGKNPKDWVCDHGPFEDEDFVDLGEEDWSLLVQNIDLYHSPSAALLGYFNFTPRWLLDDIMASFSPKGGTVGAHTDSYHVFLVQGKGERRWKIGHQALDKEDYIDDIPLKILRDDFDGEEVTVQRGDVIYIPPKFAHKGVSLQPSLTYSVGYLGPSLPEMLIEFGHYIEANPQAFQTGDSPRYLGANLSESAAPFAVSTDHMGDLRTFMTDIFDQDIFIRWITHYFTSAALDSEAEDDEEEDEGEGLDAAALIAAGDQMIKPYGIKVMITPLKAKDRYSVAVKGMTVDLDVSALPLIHTVAQEQPFSARLFQDHESLLQTLLDCGAVNSVTL